MFKRFFDLTVVILAAPFWLPLLLLSAAATAWFCGRPVLFKQARGGKGGTVFHLYKLRTMTQETDANGELLPDEQRLTAVGKFMRSTSLDELPGLLNVLRGEMSLVGPRPFIADYLPLYTPEQARRHLVLPGITGWAQVNGRNAISWEQKFELDTWYVDHQSFWLDMKIFFLTAKKVLVKEGIGAEGTQTMPRFTGTRTGEYQ